MEGCTCGTEGGEPVAKGFEEEEDEEVEEEEEEGKTGGTGTGPGTGTGWVKTVRLR